jgi:hypothetical protein
MDISAIRNRVLAIQEDLSYFDDLVKTKMRYEVNLWGIRQQMQLPDSQEQELEELQATENELLRRISNCQSLLERTREKLLKSLGVKSDNNR